MTRVILFDGWELARAPLSPPALHLLDLLAHLPAAITAELALPDAPPDWLPEGLPVHIRVTEPTQAGRQRWEQRILPDLAGDRDAILHALTPAVALSVSQPVVVSPAEESTAADGSFRGRVRRALGRGGLARAGILWPEDVPPPIEHPEPIRIAPAVHPIFSPKDFFLPPTIPGYPDLPESFFLVHIRPDPIVIRRALEAWTWASGPIGDVYPLTFLGLPDRFQVIATKWMADLHLRDTVRFLPPVAPPHLHLVYQAASAVFHPAPIDPWSSPIRYGIACARPVVGIDSAVASAVAGPAAYFAPAEDPRGLGAALISVIVRDDIRKQLVDHARRRAAGWDGEKMKKDLEGVYLGGKWGN